MTSANDDKNGHKELHGQTLAVFRKVRFLFQELLAACGLKLVAGFDST